MSSSNCNSLCALAGNWCDTTVRVHEVSYVWRINNFEFHEAEGGDLYSPVISSATSNEITWRLRFIPNGKTDAKDTVSFFLELYKKTAEKVYAKFNTFVLDSQKKTVFIKKGKVHEFNRIGNNWGRTEFLKKDDDFRNNLLVDNKLTIVCDVYFSTVRDVINDSSHQCKRMPLYPNPLACNLSENLGRLLKHGKLADVILSVDGQEYPAHKYILAARSPVFAAMFEHDTKENEQNRIEIIDMNAETLNEFLRYIYTGKCENLTEVAEGLLAAADKYNVNRLKMICAEELYKILSVENVANILAVADMHSVKELKNAAIKFIVSKRAEVLKTEGWKNIRSNFELVDEVLCSALERR